MINTAHTKVQEIFSVKVNSSPYINLSLNHGLSQNSAATKNVDGKWLKFL